MAADASAAQMPAAEGQQEPAAAGAGMLGMHMPPTGVFAKDFEVPIPYMGSSSGQFSIVNVIGQVNGVLRDVQELRSCLRLSARHAFGALDEGEPAVPARAQVPLTMKRPRDCKLDEFWQNGSNHGWEKGYGEGWKTGYASGQNDGWQDGYNKRSEKATRSVRGIGIQASFKQIQANKRSKEKKAHGMQVAKKTSIQTAPPYDVPVNDGNGGKGKGTSASAASAGGEAETLVAAVYAEDEHAVVDPEAEHPVVQHEAGVTGDDDRSATTMTPE